MGMVTDSGMAAAFKVDGERWAMDKPSSLWMACFDVGKRVGPIVLKAMRSETVTT